ncbi:MAG: DUF1353 domain-containing protein [Alphaproteobacteria bacterium]|nr:DUF1353 domain-containing protein [Alphaproteobacteria bacterium]
MAKDYIIYTDGWKYQLKEDYVIKSGIIPPLNVETEYIQLLGDGTLTIREGYAWDGPSGPTIDTKNFMRGSLVHDALYQLIREKHLPLSYRDKADRLLQSICKEDGMSAFRAWYVYQGVSGWGEDAGIKDGAHKSIYAPEKPKIKKAQ